jgi:hypothetical protein
MKWLWPTRKSLAELETSIAVRAGRMLHWAAMVFVGVLWLGEFSGIIFGYWTSSQFIIGAVILGGIAVFLLGRGLRYVFANE